MNNQVDIDDMLKEINERRERLMTEARAIVSMCKERNASTSSANDIDDNGNFTFDGAKYNISINEIERVISITFHKFRYNTTESELADAGIAFSLNADAINYCIGKWLKNEH